ncbi:MAG: SH3 domain-containing protein, partial [Treponema sp.]|nr:SH3 domain-containing protein [Treponema sp.]
YVYHDEKDKIYEPGSHYRLWLLGIDGAKSVSEVYYQTYITDDNIPLKTSNFKDAKVTALLEKGTEVRVLSVDPSLNKMEGKNGFWVLVETETERIGWLWSACLKDFSHETTRHFRDFDPIKTW